MKSMTQCKQSGCKHNHSHEEEDPCLAKHLAAVEKGNRLAERLRMQESRIIGARQKIAESIRQVPPESELRKNLVLEISSEDASGVLSTGSKIFLLLIPCDFQETEISELESVFEEVAGETEMGISRFVRLNERFCVCGNCDQKIVGALRSLRLLLRKTPAVVSSAGRGISGFLSLGNFNSAKLQLRDFVSKT